MRCFVRRTISHCSILILIAAAASTGAPSAAESNQRDFAENPGTQAVVSRTAPMAPRHSMPILADLPMIELLLEACNQESCRQVSLLYDAYELSPMTCLIVGQQEAARWQASNPAWEIRRWSCRDARSDEEHAGPFSAPFNYPIAIFDRGMRPAVDMVDDPVGDVASPCTAS